MTKEKRPFWTSAGLSFAVAYCAIACLVSATKMVFDSWIFMFCLGFALLAAGCMRTAKGGWILTAGTAVLGLLLWFAGPLEESAQGLAYHLTSIYHRGYGWNVWIWNPDAVETAPTLILLALAAGIILAVSHTVSGRKKATWAVLCGFVPLMLCCVVTDTVPQAWCLFGLLSAQLVFILSNTVRRQNQADGVRLTALLLIPVMLFTGALFYFMPQESYQGQQQQLQDAFLELLNKIPGVDIGGNGPQTGTGPNGSTSTVVGQKLNLSHVGAKDQSNVTVMFATSGQGGIMYLRGASYDVYDGTTWIMTDQQGMEGWPLRGIQSVGAVRIETLKAYSTLYTPYYIGPGEGLYSIGSSLPNEQKTTEYVFNQYLLAEGASGGGSLGNREQDYLQLPETTRQSVQVFLQQAGISQQMDLAQKVQAIGDYVRNSAQYSLINVRRMPATRTDFAVWFLQEAQYGYCVHFASAATVMLRAAGIPARYVTGYALEVRPGVRATVAMSNGHAWVEYFDSQRGAWMILEATPGDGIEMLPTEPPVTTEPPTTTEPPDNTEPPATTEPSDTTEPTEPPATTNPQGEPTEPSESEPTQPGQQQDPPREVPAWVWKIFAVLAWMLAALLAIWGQYRLRKWLRYRWMRCGKPNEQALRMRKVVGRYARALKQKLPERLSELADKARFSQHTLTNGELAEFADYLHDCEKQIRDMAWYRRLFLRLILAM